ncbi:MAG TPA: hypothetical protein PLO52_10905, partial [Flavobacterium alvei]|nr:hypothetical protein [Flavobacterium alvei]
MKKKMLFMSLLLLLFATYSCAIEELQPETTPISSEILNNVNPEFLEHDLSVYKIKPIWKSAIVFKSSSAANKKTKFNEAVEVNFTQDNKTTIPISKNGKIRGRQRLLLTFEDGKIRETIIEYIPSDSFMGDIKTINSGNFKSKQFDGKITFQNPKAQAKIVWYLTKGKLVRKARSSTKKTKTSKTARWVSVFECHTNWVCVGEGADEKCEEKIYCGWEEVWEEDDPGNGLPPDDPYDCEVDPSWPWCQDGGGGDGDGEGTPSPVFKYPLGSNYETEYPKFTNTVKNIADYVLSNPKILATLKHYTGLTGIEIYEKLQYGQGPTVMITQLNNSYGYHNPFTNTVEIDIDYVQNLENSTGNSAELLNLMLSITLLHEFVHWTDGLFFDYSQENGNNWEIGTYGFVVNMGNVSIIR